MLGFVARQPIFDGRGRVFAYELLFRPGPENVFAGGDHDFASRSVIKDSLEVFGFDALTGGRRAFVNVTRRVLVEGLFRELPADRTILEILETVDSDPEVVRACKEAKREGYLLALDDFVLRPGLEPLVPFADFIKIDWLATTNEQRADWLERLGEGAVRLLAEKIETRPQYEAACADGFTYFQGYFFQRPEMLSARVIPPHKRAALRIVGELNGTLFDFARLDHLVRQERSISERLLRDLNDAMGPRAPVSSMRQARELLGDRAFRRWATLVALATLADDRPPELMVTGLVRARFCEAVARTARVDDNALFLAGMLSAADALLGRPREDILACLELPQAALTALASRDAPQAQVLALALSYERGDWPAVTRHARNLCVSEERIPSLFRQALEWANQVYPNAEA